MINESRGLGVEEGKASGFRLQASGTAAEAKL
jgi:hypothetical protein